MTEPLTVTVLRLLAREEGLTVVDLEAIDDSVDVVVLVGDRRWELTVVTTPSPLSIVFEGARLNLWLGGNMLQFGPLIDPKRTLVERLTPVRAYCDLVLPIGNRVVFDEYDHVQPAPPLPKGRTDGGRVVAVQPMEGTVDVLIIGGTSS